MTGWMQLDGKFYYLHTDGRMVIGWQSDGTNKLLYGHRVRCDGGGLEADR